MMSLSVFILGAGPRTLVRSGKMAIFPTFRWNSSISEWYAYKINTIIQELHLKFKFVQNTTLIIHHPAFVMH